MDASSAGSITLRLLSMEAARRTQHREVRPEHLLVALCELALLDPQNLDLLSERLSLPPPQRALLHAERQTLLRALADARLDPDALLRAALALLGRGPDLALQTRTYHRDDHCKAVHTLADRLARASRCTAVEPVHVLWAIVADDHGPLLDLLTRLAVDRTLASEVCERLGQPPPSTPPILTPPSPQPPPHTRTPSTTPFLDAVGKDLTALARAGSLPHVVGMHAHVLKLCQGLLRMDKGAVLLVGEPGVGTTAAVEALAQTIAHRALPGVLGLRLGHTRIIEVPMGALVADTGLRGQFEERVQTLLAEARQHRSSVVLFIDEIHLMMGAGATQSGGLDAGNLFKPAMSRGELRLIGATTPHECARFLEKDPAIMRRWERVQIDEPDAATTLAILTELRPQLAEHYRLVIGLDALHAAVDLASRFLPDKRQPARSLDLLHEACAHMMCLHHDTQHWKDPTRTTPSPERLALTPTIVAEIVARRCKLPVDRVLSRDDALVAEVRAALQAGIFGQPEAIDAVSDIVARAAQGLTDPQRPDGVFLLVGPSGTGKTALARTVAHAMFGQRRERFVNLDMAEFADPSHVSRLLGAAPGYAGFEQGGALTEPVRQNPYCVLLLDAVDQAHPDALKLLLQIFDRGHLTDTHGRLVDFSNALIFMTMTLPPDRANAGIGPTPPDDPDPRSPNTAEARRREAQARRADREARKRLPPELFHHVDRLIAFRPLDPDALRLTADKLLETWRRQIAARGASLTLTDAAYAALIEAGSSPIDGARATRRAIEQGVIQAVANLGIHPSGPEPLTITVDVIDGDFVAR